MSKPMIYTVYRLARFGLRFHKWRWGVGVRVMLNSAGGRPYDTCYGLFTVLGAPWPVKRGIAPRVQALISLACFLARVIGLYVVAPWWQGVGR